MTTIPRTPQPKGGPGSSGAGAGSARADSFGNKITWQKGESGEKVKVIYSGDNSKWKSGVTRFDDGTTIQLTVPGTRWVVTIPKKEPETAHADDSFHDHLDFQVNIGENPSQIQVPNGLRKEVFAVFNDGNGKIYGIGLNSLYLATAKAPAAPEDKPKPAQQAPPTAQASIPMGPPQVLGFAAQETAPPPESPGIAIGPHTAEAQNDANSAIQALQDAEKTADPAEIRFISKVKQQAEAYAAQAASSSGMGGDTAKYLLPNFYSRLLLQGARGGNLNDPKLLGAARNYLSKENYLRNAYVQDAWTGIQDAWKSSPPDWQRYYGTRWKSFYGKSPDPWRAFASDVVANGSPQESAIIQASRNYLAYDNLRRSSLNPFLYPMALAGQSNSFQQQQFNIPGFPGLQNFPDAFGGLAGTPMVQALYGNIQSGIAQMTGFISNLWGGPPPAYFYNFQRPGVSGGYPIQ